LLSTSHRIYYDCYGYLPLYVFCGRHFLAAKLRRSNIGASAGAAEEVQRIVHQIRARWPRVKIVLRAGSGFAREGLMAWCEQNRVDFVFGLARNARLETRAEAALREAWTLAEATGQPARVFRDFLWSTKETWSRHRRVVAEAEWTRGEANPRFLVTSLKPDRWAGQALYEDLYCARGEMENRIKEAQGDLFADRTSAAAMRANQLRLWFAAMAYVLLCALCCIGLAHTALAAATCGTIRLKLLKIGALVRISARRVKVAIASACPTAAEWRLAQACLIAARASPAYPAEPPATESGIIRGPRRPRPPPRRSAQQAPSALRAGMPSSKTASPRALARHPQAARVRNPG
jgi:hypothetical protein